MAYSPQLAIHRKTAGTDQGTLGRPVHANAKVARGKMSPPYAAQYSRASGGARPLFFAAARE